MRLPIKTLILLLLIISTALSARTSDGEEPIHIEADSVEIRERQGVSIYRGNVRITRGSMRIDGDLIHIYSTPQGLDKIVVEGKPARFEQLNDQNQEISAQSLHMTYSADNGLLVMKQDAILVQKDNRFTSEHIIYNTRRDIVQAGEQDGPAKSGDRERVTITIQPDKNAPSENSDPPQ